MNYLFAFIILISYMCSAMETESKDVIYTSSFERSYHETLERVVKRDNHLNELNFVMGGDWEDPTLKRRGFTKFYLGYATDKNQQTAILVRAIKGHDQPVCTVYNLGSFPIGMVNAFRLCTDSLIYMMPSRFNEGQFELKEAVMTTDGNLTSSSLGVGPFWLLYTTGLSYTVKNLTIDQDFTSILKHPTNTTIMQFIKSKIGREDIDIEILLNKRTEGSYRGWILTESVALVTSHGIPSNEDAYYLILSPYYSKFDSIGTFAPGSFSLIGNKDPKVVYAGRELRTSKFVLGMLKTYPTVSISITEELLIPDNSKPTFYSHDGIIIGSIYHPYFSSIKALIFDEKSNHISNISCEELDLNNINFEKRTGMLYCITPNKEQEFSVYTLIKDFLHNRYELHPTNLKTSEYIHNIVPDSADPSRILAYQTGKLSTLTWKYLDDDFRRKVSELTLKIYTNLGELSDQPWRYSEFTSAAPRGSIEFDGVLLRGTNSKVLINYDADGKFEEPLPDETNFIPFPTPVERQTFDSDGYPIDYAVFRAPNKPTEPAKTIMIIDGGPQNFIDYKDHADKILCFNSLGYHIVIPQGLFRLGYPVQHIRKSHMKFGTLDIEHFRCVIRDLLTQSITDQPVFVMGHSYGGYSCVRLAYDADLVKAAVVENAFLERGENNHNRAFNRIDDESLFPALNANLPRVPIFIIGTQNDTTCPISYSRKFADRLLTNGLLFTYLECPSGGHKMKFDHLNILLDFFENQYGEGFKHQCPDGYEVKADTNNFFR